MTPSAARARALKEGYRSGLEEAIAEQLSNSGIEYTYEQRKLAFTQPAKERTYLPDFQVETITGKSIIIETKGRWLVADRQKMLLVIEQHPDLDIRIVFQNARARISKRSRTTYSAWCDKHGIKWAHRRVPEEWLHE